MSGFFQSWYPPSRRHGDQLKPVPVWDSLSSIGRAPTCSAEQRDMPEARHITRAADLRLNTGGGVLFRPHAAGCPTSQWCKDCLLYTSDAADDLLCVDL